MTRTWSASTGSSSQRHRCPGGAALRRRPPGDETTFLVFHDVIVPELAVAEDHGEHVADRLHPLAGCCLGEVVVAVPAWLLGRVGDQFEYNFEPGRDDSAGADDGGDVVLLGHGPIQPQSPHPVLTLE